MIESNSKIRLQARLGFVLFAFLGVGAVVLRLRNAWRYPLNMGFDAQGNWAYIESLRQSGVLPDPETAWSAAHPPLFYALSAGLSALLGHPDQQTVVVATRIVSSVIGLGAIASIVFLVRRLAPQEPLRAWLSGALVLFLPVHIYMSAMLSEEILVSSLTTFVVVGVIFDLRGNHGVGRPLALGALAGLALLTKLSGVLVIASAGAAYLIAGWLERGAYWGWVRALAVGLGASVTGGWFYLQRWFTEGYLYPSGLEVHRLMFAMPPGERGWVDYVAFPLRSLTDPDLLSSEMIHSVWGSTYATIWFDGHRHFLPIEAPGLAFSAFIIGLLALIPTLAFFVGCARAVRRMTQNPNAVDGLLLSLTAMTLLGYMLFTWRNPWFATVKGSFLLGLVGPFAIYGSEGLVAGGLFLRERARAVAWTVGLGLMILWLSVLLTFSFEGIFFKREYPGLDWRSRWPSESGASPVLDEELVSPLPNRARSESR